MSATLLTKTAGVRRWIWYHGTPAVAADFAPTKCSMSVVGQVVQVGSGLPTCRKHVHKVSGVILSQPSEKKFSSVLHKTMCICGNNFRYN